MLSAKQFLKKYSNVPNAFIDELYDMYNEHSSPFDLSINLDVVSSWLSIPKKNLIKTLNESYKNNMDYIIKKAPNPNKKDPRNNNYKLVLITPECFKRICMQSRSKKAEEVRTYFIQVEYTLLKYRDDLVQGLENRIAQLERNQKPKNANPSKQTKEGFIYVIKASETNDSYVKIGRTKDLRQRLANYGSGKADDIEVLFTYETDDIESVEACVKALMKKNQYRKYKEVYKADIDMIKGVIHGCSELNLKMRYRSRKAPTMKGGYYIAVCGKSEAA